MNKHILLILPVLLLCSCKPGSKYYPDIADALGSHPDSVLTLLESRKPETEAGKRKQAEYTVLHELAFSELYGFAEVDEKERIRESEKYFSSRKNQPMQVLALEATGQIQYSENDYKAALAAYSEALRTIDWKKNAGRARKICSEMALCYQAAGIEIDEGQYLFFAYQGFNASRIRNEKIRFGALGMLFLAILATLIWYFKARKMAMERELEKIKAETEESISIAEDLKARLAAIKGKSITGTDLLERICAQYYVNEGSDRLQGSVVKEVRSIIEGFRSDPSVLQSVENSLNAANDHVMTRLREAFPKWKDEDFRIYAFTAAGFSSTTIATLLEKDKPFVYNRLYRIKSRIQASDSPYKDLFLTVLQ